MQEGIALAHWVFLQPANTPTITMTSKSYSIYGICPEVEAGTLKGYVKFTTAISLIKEIIGIHTKKNTPGELCVIFFPELSLSCDIKTNFEQKIQSKFPSIQLEFDLIIIIGLYLSGENNRNQAAVLIFGKNRPLEVEWQPKLTQADEEKTPETPPTKDKIETNLFKSTFTPIGILTCSDLFKNQMGKQRSVLDELLEKYNKGNKIYPLIIFNPQFTRSPDDKVVLLQLEEMSRKHGSLFVFQTNPIYKGATRHRVAGRFLTSEHKTEFPAFRKVKGLSTQLSGVEFPWTEGFYHVLFEITRDGKLDCSLAEYYNFQTNRRGVKIQKYESRHITLIEKLPQLSLSAPSDPIGYARSLANLGEIDAAESILRSHLKKLRNKEKIDVLHKLGTILQQHGRYNQAFETYYHAYKKANQVLKETSEDPTRYREKSARAEFRMYHTRFLQNGHVDLFLSHLRRLENLTVAKSSKTTAFRNLTRHIYQCRAYKINSDIFSELKASIVSLSEASQKENEITEHLHLEIILANLLRSQKDFSASKNTAEKVLKSATNIKNTWIEEHALRCLTELAWRQICDSTYSNRICSTNCIHPPACMPCPSATNKNVKELIENWNKWKNNKSPPRITPYRDFLKKLAQYRLALWNAIPAHQFANNQKLIDRKLCFQRAKELAETVKYHYGSEVEVLLIPLVGLIEKSTEMWWNKDGRPHNPTFCEFKSTIEPFKAWAEDAPFWRMKELSTDLGNIQNHEFLQRWQKLLLLPNFQLWN